MSMMSIALCFWTQQTQRPAADAAACPVPVLMGRVSVNFRRPMQHPPGLCMGGQDARTATSVRGLRFNPLAACACAGKPGPLPAIEPRGMPPRRISAVRAGFLAAEIPECTRAWAYAHIAKSRAGCIHHGHGRKPTRASAGRIPPATRQGPRARAARFPRAAVAAEGSLKSWRPR